MTIRRFFISVVLAFGCCASQGALAAEMLVSNTVGDNVLRYSTSNGAFLGEFVSSGSGGLNQPIGMATDEAGRLYVASFVTGQVLRYGTNGSFLDVFTSAAERPLGIAFKGGNLFVGSYTFNTVRQFGADGTFLGTFTPTGALSDPIALAFGAGGDLFVSSFIDSKVVRFDGTTGALIGTFASGNGLTNPWGLVFGPDNNLYVSSFATDQILRFDGATGDFLNVFAGAAQLDGPRGLAFGPDGDLYVVSLNNNSVVRFDGTSGAFESVFVTSGSGGLNGPKQILFIPEPSSLVLFGMGFAAVFVIRRRMSQGRTR